MVLEAPTPPAIRSLSQSSSLLVCVSIRETGMSALFLPHLHQESGPVRSCPHPCPSHSEACASSSRVDHFRKAAAGDTLHRHSFHPLTWDLEPRSLLWQPADQPIIAPSSHTLRGEAPQIRREGQLPPGNCAFKPQLIRCQSPPGSGLGKTLRLPVMLTIYIMMRGVSLAG